MIHRPLLSMEHSRVFFRMGSPQDADWVVSGDTEAQRSYARTNGSNTGMVYERTPIIGRW
ncbi:hypothetical protein [Duncaniella muricolitica]|uniref:hypothetical protein n=1 Tax=Duncaniella muricolitica TaxID=2880704 RepID=UPI00244E2A55|nr:hypothetical protein [Duncaniella muricolitica]